MRKQTYYGAVALCALIVGALAITNQSLWIDEGSAALKAMEPSLGGWWHNLRTEGNSNLQLPGELFYLWVWEKIFGASEISLRASNIPFFAAGVVALAWGLAPRRPRQTAVVLLAFSSAFLCYYLSEARPYLVLFGFAAITAACLFRLRSEPEESLASALWYRLFCLGIFGLCATSLIAVPWALGALTATLYGCGYRAIYRAARQGIIASALLAISLALLGAYYLWTMQLGVRASDVGRTGWSNIAFIFYELLGLAGLGPGRLQLRSEGIAPVVPFLPFLTLGAAAVTLLLAFSARPLARGKKTIIFFLLAAALPFALVLVAGASAHMRLLGRHLTPLLPFLLALLSLGLANLLTASAWWRKLLAWGTLGIFLLSALEIRLAPRHRRDDYRTAAAIGRQAQISGKRVWWLADASTGLYYGISSASPLLSTSPDLQRPKSPPNTVILSKPDIYDVSGTAHAYLTANHFKVTRVLPAFQIWTRSPDRSPTLRFQDK